MPNSYLPAEILDHIADHLHDTEATLQNCCLVSKSWIPRIRKHLFAIVDFSTPKCLETWKETFPDPLTSPGRYAKTLSINNAELATVADAEAGGWIRGFSSVQRFEVNTASHESTAPFVPFHGFSSAIKSLRVVILALPPSSIFNLILSFPLLEDLTMVNYFEAEAGTDDSDGSEGNETQIAARSAIPSMFTGSLELYLQAGIERIARRLLSLPGGIHFRNLTLTWCCEEELSLMVALVEECSHTIESLNIASEPFGMLGSASINLSKATKLKDVAFRPQSWTVEWVTTALKTIIPQHRDLQQISIRLSYPTVVSLNGINVDAAPWETVGEVGCREWLDLDHELVQLWESRLIRPRVAFVKEGDVRDSIRSLLPEITKRGIIDLVESVYIA